MKRLGMLNVMVGLFILLLPSFSQGEDLPSKPSPGDPPKGEEKSLGIAIGLRSTYFRMQQNQGDIFRNIKLLDEEQDLAPYKPFLQYHLSNYWAIELGYDQFKAITLNKAFDDVAEFDRRWVDGALEWQPIMLTAQFRWPHFHKSFVPYVLGGVSYTKTSWKRNEWYYFGFPNPETYTTWTSQGNRPEDYPNNNYRRIFAVDDHCIGTIFGLGVDYFLMKNLALNLDWRYHWAQVKFKYTLAFNDGLDPISQDQGTFILDSWILGLGIKYLF